MNKFHETLYQPSQNYFPSHMSQTLSSMRRQGKGPLQKNSERYGQEEQVKNLLRKIKQKRIELHNKAAANEQAR